MTRKDYIEKINQNLEHLTKDELKDVATLTNAQFGVRLKVAEKEYWGKEITDLKSQLQQQALPVVPECVGNYIEECKENRYALNIALDLMVKEYASRKTELSTWVMNNQEQFAKAWFGKYEVEKPQLFYLKNKLTGLNLVLEQSFNATGKHVGERFREFDMQYIATDEQEARLYKNTFSKAEINNMQTGSYEQIKVEEVEE